LQHNDTPIKPSISVAAIMAADTFQIFSHPKLGIVIYDPVAQMGLAREQMRLFKLGTMGASTFMRAIVSKDLAPSSADVASATETAVTHYRSARANRRKPYCEQCRRHFGSVDFTVCSDCSGIRCTCGTCSCASSSRRRKAA
jgi:hypothetical protein